jgi:glycosyltransferase involved in cell wall biosynthesis
MAAGLRILLVSRRFWPQVGDSEDAMADLADGLRRHGAQPTVLSARWAADWPRISHFQGVPVHRIPLRLDQPWGHWTSLLGLARWLRRHRSQFDVVLVARLRREAAAALWALRRSAPPIVLRAEADDVAWQSGSVAGLRCRYRCQQASAIVYRGRAVQNDLIQAGFRPSSLYAIPEGIRASFPRRGDARRAARLALAKIHADFYCPTEAPIALFVGRLRPKLGLARLVQAWEHVVSHRSTAKLWLIGDGPYRDDLYRWISDLDLRHCVRMPGTFECLDELLHAADLLVYPESTNGLPRICLAAAASGLPVLARSSPELQFELQQQPALQSPIMLLDRSDVGGWSEALLDRLTPSFHSDSLSASSRIVQRDHSMARMIRRHLDLFQSLIQKPGR